MTRLISIIILGLLFSLNSFAQQKTFGYRIVGSGDIVSNVFPIQNGFVLDSARNASTSKIYRFEYNEEGKLKRDINFWQYAVQEGRFLRYKPGYRDYFYNERGDVDSVAEGHWNDSAWVSDPYGYRIDYSYDADGRILSKIYSDSGEATRIEKYSFDSHGNPVSDTAIVVSPADTAYNSRGYDEQNRLTLSRYAHSGFLSPVNLNVYIYDSSGNVHYTVRSITSGDTSNVSNCYLTFDQAGKVVEELRSNQYLPDSTWIWLNAVLYSYDELGRILKFGDYNWFHYDPDGNLDTLTQTHTVPSIFTSASLKDSYGNTITLPDYSGVTCFYYSRLVTGISSRNAHEETFALSQNFPNPFNPSTEIRYSIPVTSHVTLKLFDILGREIRTLVNTSQNPGTYSVTLNAQNLASGVYLYRLITGDFSATKKLVLVR